MTENVAPSRALPQCTSSNIIQTKPNELRNGGKIVGANIRMNNEADFETVAGTFFLLAVGLVMNVVRSDGGQFITISFSVCASPYSRRVRLI